VAKHNSNSITKFADDTTVVGLITDNDETAYREEVREPAVWSQDNRLSLNVCKTKELIVDYRKRRVEQAPILIDGAVVEQVEIFKFLGVHITNKLSWFMVQTYQDSRKEGTTILGPQILKMFYSCTIESILTGCITTWYGNWSASECKALQRVV
jgi:hypothetical protein